MVKVQRPPLPSSGSSGVASVSHLPARRLNGVIHLPSSLPHTWPACLGPCADQGPACCLPCCCCCCAQALLCAACAACLAAAACIANLCLLLLDGLAVVLPVLLLPC